MIEEFEHSSEEGFDYELLREIDQSVEYKEFRRHYTTEIREFLNESDGKFLMTHNLATTIIFDVVEIIKKQGYEIVKKKE